MRELLDWPDQNEAAPQLGLSVRTLARARTRDHLKPEHYRRDGRTWRYDVEAIKSDPSYRCSTDGCDGLALTTGKCPACHYSNPRTCPDCGGPKAHKADLCRDCSADHGKLVKVRADAVEAKRKKHKRARERWKAEGLVTSRDVADVMHAASPMSVYNTYVPAGLKVARVEVVAGARYELYAEPVVARFVRDWARGRDGRRQRWWRAEVAGSVLGGRDGLTARSVRDGEQRARDRRAAFVRFLRGRRRTPEVEERHRRWAELYADLHDWHERQEAATGAKVPSHFALCFQVAQLDAGEHRDDWDYEPETARRAAAARVARALKALQMQST